MHIFPVTAMIFTMYLFLQIMYLPFRVVGGELNGYYCTGSKSGNMHFKCIKTPCNGTLCETIIDYLEQPGPEVIMDTNNKVLLNLEIENISTIHVLFINYVRDSVNSNKNTTYRLLKPIVLKVQLAGPRELYKLRFINYVNGGPTEEVISKETRQNYFGCDSGNINPTCGMLYYNLNEPVPFSEGFCCSCLDSVNAARQLGSPDSPNRNNISATTNANIQPRGEQDCKNISSSPGYANSYTYHESAHCFRYSDLWFNVYKVEKSETILPLTLKLFKKSKSSVYELHQQCFSSSSSNSKMTIFKDLISYRYKVKGLNETVSNDLMAMFILIPQDVPKAYQYGLPHLNDRRAGKYLAIHPSKMSKNGGAECDRIGVNPRAFYEQPDRCYRPRDSCLGKQPVQLLQQREGGCGAEPLADAGDGRLYIEDFVQGDVSFDDVVDSIIVDRQPASCSAEPPVSVQSVGEIRLDDNTVVNDKILLQISEIHVIFVNNCNNTAKVLVFVTNLGLKTAEFFVDTSGPLDSKKIEKQHRKLIVHPQQTGKIYLEFEYVIDCTATVRLYEDHTSITAVASRKYKVVRGSSCYCLWHRRCKCYQVESPSSTAAGSRSLSQAEYTKAGFLGDVPPRTAVAQVAVRNRDTLVASLVLLIGYLVVALALGLLKAVSPYRSHWLWAVGVGQRPLGAYIEPELRPFQVVLDDGGYCVHPVTRSRHIRLLGRGQEFVTNALFFVVLPTTVCRWCRSLTNGYCSISQDKSSSCRMLSARRMARDGSSSNCELSLHTSCLDLPQQIISDSDLLRRASDCGFMQ